MAFCLTSLITSYLTYLIMKSESRSVVSDSLRHIVHRLYSPWNSPGQNTGVGSLSLLQGIFPTLGSNPGLLHCRGILYQLSHKGRPPYNESNTNPTQSFSIKVCFTSCHSLEKICKSNFGILTYTWERDANIIKVFLNNKLITPNLYIL